LTVTTIPHYERQLFVNTAHHATRLASSGFVFAGWKELRTGLEHAEAAKTCGEDWGEVLVDRYETAIRSYTRRFGGKLLGPGRPAAG
jgi:hypothetical protein